MISTTLLLIFTGLGINQSAVADDEMKIFEYSPWGVHKFTPNSGDGGTSFGSIDITDRDLSTLKPGSTIRVRNTDDGRIYRHRFEGLKQLPNGDKYFDIGPGQEAKEGQHNIDGTALENPSDSDVIPNQPVPGGPGEGGGIGGKIAGELGGMAKDAAGAALMKGVVQGVYEKLVITGRDRAEIQRFNDQIAAHQQRYVMKQIDIHNYKQQVQKIVQDALHDIVKTPSTIELYLKKYDDYNVMTQEPEMRHKLQLARNSILNQRAITPEQLVLQKAALRANKYADSMFFKGSIEVSEEFLDVSIQIGNMVSWGTLVTAAPRLTYEVIVGQDFITGQPLSIHDHYLAVIGTVMSGAKMAAKPLAGAVDKLPEGLKDATVALGGLGNRAWSKVDTAGKIKDWLQLADKTDRYFNPDGGGPSVGSPLTMDEMFEVQFGNKQGESFVRIRAATENIVHYFQNPITPPTFSDPQLTSVVKTYYQPTPGGRNGSLGAQVRRERITKGSSTSTVRAHKAVKWINEQMDRPDLTSADRHELWKVHKDLMDAMIGDLLFDYPQTIAPAVQMKAL